MTTIATDGKSMAGDGLAVRNSLITAFGSPKVVRLNDGRIVGAAGEKPCCHKFRAWLQDGDPKPKFRDFSALVLHPDGRLFYHTDSDVEGTLAEAPNAIGTGSEIAIGAMLAGKSPEEAVAIASQRDVYTGGEIVSFRIESPLRAVNA